MADIFVNPIPIVARWGMGADYAHQIGVSPFNLKMFSRACGIYVFSIYLAATGVLFAQIAYSAYCALLSRWSNIVQKSEIATFYFYCSR